MYSFTIMLALYIWKGESNKLESLIRAEPFNNFWGAYSPQASPPICAYNRISIKGNIFIC